MIFLRILRTVLILVGLSSLAFPASFTVAVVQAPSGFFNVVYSGVNNSGQVVGWGNTATTQQAFLASASTSAAIPFPTGSGYNQAVAYSVNSSGQVAGWASNGTAQAFIGTTSGSTVIPTPGGYQFAYGMAINDTGQLAGTAENTGSFSTARPFIGTTAGSTVIPIPPGWSGATASGINSFGQVVGLASNGTANQAFLSTLGGSAAIPMPPGWTAVNAVSLNDSGQVAGSGNNGTTSQAFVGTVTGTTAIPLPNGATFASTFGGISSVGSVVGNSDVGPWIWNSTTGVRLLSGLVPASASAGSVLAISGNGQILASGTVSGVQSQYFVLSPCAFSISPTSISPSGNASSSSVTVTTATACDWTASSNSSWLTITSGTSGTGSGAVNFNIAANTGEPRVGTLTVAGQTFTVTQGQAPPAIPILVAPVNGAAGVSLTPALSWGSASGATSYDVYFGTSNTPSLVTNVNGTGYAPGTLLPGQTYFWRIVAKNGGGGSSSAVWSFATATQGSPPGAPTLNSPANGAKGVSLAPSLTWNAAAGATSYDVYLGTSATPPFATNVTGTSYGPVAVTSGQTYYWQIVARNAGGSAPSGVWSFSPLTPGTTSYTVTVIPSPPGFTNVSMSSLNNFGQVAGSGNNGTTTQGFIGAPSGSVAVPLPAGWTAASAFVVNDAGQVTGVGNPTNTSDQAFLGTTAGSVPIPLTPGAVNSFGFALNSLGQVAGGVNGTVGGAFIGTPAGSSGIPAPAGWTSLTGQGVNNLGQVSGNGTNAAGATQAFIGSTAGSTAVPMPAGWTSMVGGGINDLGQMAGWGVYSGSDLAFVGTTGGIATIPLPPGGLNAAATAINNQGVVVGQASTGGWIWDPVDGTVLLNNLVPAGWNILYARGISDRGLILAQASLNSGPTEYVELSIGPASGCSFSLPAWSVPVASSAGAGSLMVAASGGCNWVAVSNSSWLTITSGASGSGSGQVSFNIGANSGPSPRVGTLTVAGFTFTVIQAATAPSAPTLLFPANGATGVSLAAALSWTVSSGATSYDVYFGTSASPPLVGNDLTTSYSPGTLTLGVTYYWQIVAKNASGTAASAVWSFNTSALAVAVGGIIPAAGSGSSQTFTFTFTDTKGFADLSVLDVLISTFLSGQTACYFALAPTTASTGYIYLVDDAGDGGYAGAPMPLPSTGLVQNSQCAINATGSSVSAGGNTLTLTLAITFKEGFAGNKAVYMAARSSTQNSGWQALGTWNVPGTTTGPAVGGVSPARSTSMGQTYTFTFTDSNGYADLFVLDVLTNSVLTGTNACYFAYVPTTPTNGYLYLVDDAGDGGYAPGSPIGLSSGGILQNSQCSINTAGSSSFGSGNTLTLNLAITFKAGFAGNQVFYMAARNNSTGNSGWQAAGSVTVP